MKQYKSLIKYAIDKMDFLVSVFDMGDWAVIRSNNFGSIYKSIESVDVSELRFRNKHGEITGKACVCLMNDDNESITDFTSIQWMLDWESSYIS
ncbi:MAG: hypothetical protein QM504_03220 [Pseudomonadota bacterium]